MKNLYLSIFLLFLASVSSKAQVVSSFPYFENLESGSQWNGNGEWELGNPTFGYSAFSGNNAWVTDLDDRYDDRANDYLTSPSFNFSQLSNVYLSFQLASATESCCDYLELEYSTNGSSFNNIPTSSLIVNPYQNFQGWTGFYNYFQTALNLSFLAGQNNVRLRFRFSSDGSVTQAGFFIDDILIDQNYSGPIPAPIDLALDTNNKNFNVRPCGNKSFPIRVWNYGTQTASGGSYSINYSVGNQSVQSFTGFSSIPSGSSRSYSIDLNNAPNGQNEVSVWVVHFQDTIPGNDSVIYSVSVEPNNDIALAFVSVINSGGNPCQISNPPLVVGIENYVPASATLAVNYQVEGYSVVTETFNNIDYYCTNSTEFVQFSQGPLFDTTGTYKIKAWIDTPYRDNDTVSFDYFYIAPEQTPYLETFETYDLGATSGNLLPRWTEVNGSGNWSLSTGRFDSLAYGPKEGYGQSEKYLLYNNEQSFGGPFTHDISGPCIEVPNDSAVYNLSFFLHDFLDRNLCDFSNLGLVVLINNFSVINPINIGQLSDRTNNYRKFTIDVSQYKGQSIRIQFQAIRNFSGGGCYPAFAIDNISIYPVSRTDIELLSVENPDGNTCGIQSDQVQVRFKNNGSSNLTSFQACYSLNGEGEICESVGGGIIAPGFVDSYTFNTKLPFDEERDNLLKVYLKASSDSVPQNDTILVSYESIRKTLPFFENFNDAFDFNQYWDALSNFRTYEWKLNSGVTPTIGTGPEFDADSNSTGFYAHTEYGGSGNNLVDTAILVYNPCFDFSQTVAQVMEFDYHMYGRDINKLFIFGYTDKLILLDSVVGQQQSSFDEDWKTKRVVIDTLAEKIASFAFYAIKSGIGDKSDIAIDNFTLKDTLTSLVDVRLEGFELKLFPNPTNNRIYLQSGQDLTGSNFILMSVDGKRIIDGVFSKASPSLDVSDFENGIYILQIQSNEQVTSRRFVKME